MQYIGDFPTSATVYVLFNTYSSDDPSASMTITGLALADIRVYKNGGTTERASTSGYTLLDTDGIDFDGLTGIHGFSIDTSDNTDVGFYAAGSEYTVVVSSVTLDAATVSFVAGHFSIERSGGVLALLKNGTYGLDQLVRATTPANTLDVNATGEAGLDLDNTSGTLAAAQIATDAITADKIAAAAITSSEFTALSSTALGALEDQYDGTGLTGDTYPSTQSQVGSLSAGMAAAFTEIKGATWASGTDTLEAIRDRGDAAWITATSVTVSDKTGFSLAADQSAVTLGTVNLIAGTIGTLDALDTAQDTQHATTQADIAALNDISVADVYTTQMTESYATDGTAPTMAQSLFMIQQFLQEKAVTSTTMTVKQLDGSTTAMTFTLDSATAPTSITRAT